MVPSPRFLVVGVSTAVNTLAWSARSTFALFYVAMLEELAWGRGPTALGYSLSWLGFVGFAPLAGWLSDRCGVRAVVTVGGLALGLALALTGQATSLTQYYLAFGASAPRGSRASSSLRPPSSRAGSSAAGARPWAS